MPKLTKTSLFRDSKGRFLPSDIQEALRTGRPVDPQKSPKGRDQNHEEIFQDCLESIPLFASLFLPEHCNEAFADFHKELFELLHELVKGRGKGETKPVIVDSPPNAENTISITPGHQTLTPSQPPTPQPPDMDTVNNMAQALQDGTLADSHMDIDRERAGCERQLAHGEGGGHVRVGDVGRVQPPTQFSNQISSVTEVSDIVEEVIHGNHSSPTPNEEESKPRVSEHKSNDIKGGTLATRVKESLAKPRGKRISKFERLAIAAPRGHAKSTLVSLVFVLWCVVYKLENYILIISDSEDQSKMNLDAVKAELESNDLLRAVYGDLVGKVWGAEAIETSNAVRVQVRGSGQRIRGLKYRHSRPGLVVCDDLENDTHVETSEQRDKLKRWFSAALKPALRKGGKLVVIGTILHEDSLLAELLNSRGWCSKVYTCETDGCPLWPDHYSFEDLMEIKAQYQEKGQLDIFFREYYNQIIDIENAVFQRAYFNYLTVDELFERRENEDFKTFLTVDPAYTQSASSDFTAFVVTMTDVDKNLIVVDCVKRRMSMKELIDTWFDLVETYQPDGVGIQKIDWAKSLRMPMLDEMRRRQIFFRVKELQVYSKNAGMFNKNARIERLGPRYASGQILHITDGRGIKDLEQELESFPRAKHDDLADALSMQIDLIYPPSPRRKPKRFYEKERLDPISGYPI